MTGQWSTRFVDRRPVFFVPEPTRVARPPGFRLSSTAMATRTPAKPASRGGEALPSATRRSRRDWPYRFELVPLDQLFIDDAYQRPLTSFVNQVADDYDPALLGCLIVSERTGAGRGPNGETMAVIDGQTRTEATRRVEESDGLAPRDPDGNPVMACLVYIGLSREREADLFSDLQTKRRGMATYLRFRAALVAKKPEALAIAAIAQSKGFELDVNETPHTLKAIAALESVFRRDPELLARVLGIIAAAWPDPTTEGRASADMIRGLGIFLRRERRVDDARLIDRLSSIAPRTLRHRANALQEGSGSGTGGRAQYMADAILGVYMRGGRRESNS